MEVEYTPFNIMFTIEAIERDNCMKIIRFKLTIQYKLFQRGNLGRKTIVQRKQISR